MADDGQVRLLAAKTIRSLQAEVDRLQRDNYLLRRENRRLGGQCSITEEAHSGA